MAASADTIMTLAHNNSETDWSTYCPPNIPGTSGAKGCLSAETRVYLTILFSILTFAGFLANGLVIAYIVVNRLYRNFVSSHFIAHLSLTNMLACTYLLPIYIYNFSSHTYLSSSSSPTTTTTTTTSSTTFPPTSSALPVISSPTSFPSISTTLTMQQHSVAFLEFQDPEPYNLFHQSPSLCRIHAFLTCTIWSVICYMTTCVAGVHLLTFARIHYDQLFGLPPSVICLLSWVIGAALGLPCLTNTDIVKHDPLYNTCIWGYSINGYKFLAYILLLGVILPLLMTMYSYIRVLGIFYHSPIVFQALGLYKSRFLVYALLVVPFSQAPFYVTRVLYDLPPWVHPTAMFVAYFMCIADPVLFGTSLFLMKEEDMALTTRGNTHKSHNPYAQPPPLSPSHL